jgi:putative tryptophan/tyrosine transport system substrate-binding protein
MKRREFVALLGGAAAWPLAARAQQPAVRTIGYLSPRAADVEQEFQTAFRQGLSETGHVEGRNHPLAGLVLRLGSIHAARPPR